jgi:hypothetical protein
MRAAHQNLLQTPGAKQLTPQRRRAILQFLAAGERTGAVLQSRSDRSAAQALIDYWVGVLFVPPSLPEQDPVPDFLLAPFNPASAPDLPDRDCPYTGLAAFQEKDANRFYGREEAVKTLLDKVRREPVVLVSGPSGSGKSSLVFAGLLPGLKAGPTDGSGGWYYLPPVVPGNDPIGLLLRALCPAGANPREWVDEQKRRVLADRTYLRGLVEPSAGERPAFLVVDQFEELFTLCEDQEERKAYAAVVAGLAGGPSGNRVVLTIREDFLREAGELPALKPVVVNPEARFSPPAMFPRELRQVIERPAAMVGLTFDEGIVDDLVKEVAGEPTALPLLQFTLLRLWANRTRNRISWEAYRTVGSPREALKRTADAVYQQLPQELDRQVARLIFLELVQPSVGVEFVRRRVRRESLRSLASSVTVDLVLERFTTAGLIRRTPGVDADDDRFEVAHEALIRNWPLLDGWLQRKREQSAKEIQLVAAARLWRESGRQNGYLLTGTALGDAQPYSERSPEIDDFVKASQANQLFWRRLSWGVMTGAVAVLLAFVVILLSLLSSERMARRKAAENARQANQNAQWARQAATNAQALLLARSQRLSAPHQAVIPTRKRQRPIQPGLVIGAETGHPSGGGVLTAFVTDRQPADQALRKTYLLTLPLVLSAGPLQAKLRVYQPVPVVGRKPNEADVIADVVGRKLDEADLIGEVSRWLEANPNGVNHALGVIAEVTVPPSEWSPSVYGFGPITRAGRVKQGAQVQFVGWSAILKSGQVKAVPVRTKIAGLLGPNQGVDFDNLIAIQSLKEGKAGGDG